MAQTDETARRIYKYLMSLHSDCRDILKLVEEAGTLSREIKTIDEQVKIVTFVSFLHIHQTKIIFATRNSLNVFQKETESRKNIRSKLKQMQIDLEQIGSENQVMERALSMSS